jgi:hypothetical protein
MPITINGAGSIVGISAGGLPDASVITADIADANVTAAKLSGAQTGSAPIYGCRAWVNFDGTRNEADTGASTNGANVKIRASGNVTSVLKNGTGDYTVTFTTAMVDANYCSTLSINTGSVTGSQFTIGELSASISTAPTVRSTTQLRLNISTTAPTVANFDATSVSVAIFR